MIDCTKMSVFLEILYRICCWNDEQGKDDLNCDNESLLRNKSRNPNPSDYHAIDPFPRTFAPTTYTNHFIKQNNAKTGLQNIQSQSYSNSSKLAQTSINTSLSVRTQEINQKNSVPNKLLDASKVPHKPTILPSLSSSSYVVQSKTVNFETNKTADQKWTQNFSPISSQPSPSPSSSKPPTLSKQTQSLTRTHTTFSKPSPSLSVPPLSSSKPTSPSSLSSSSFQTSSFPKPPPLSNKPTLSPASSNPKNDQTHTKYIWVQEGSSPTHVIPEDIKELIKKDVVPGVLKKPLSPLTYKDYFHALLYAEDYYLEVHRTNIFISANIL
ncbi:unnamed protein product [Ilex paraguariensis]|uniref:Uncharacterized protein n=1 Tax=Ilex paraguariensis TaxID=185542 RepID=A0ABC8QZ52_9AQUA